MTPESRLDQGSQHLVRGIASMFRVMRQKFTARSLLTGSGPVQMLAMDDEKDMGVRLGLGATSL